MFDTSTCICICFFSCWFEYVYWIENIISFMWCVMHRDAFHSNQLSSFITLICSFELVNSHVSFPSQLSTWTGDIPSKSSWEDEFPFPCDRSLEGDCQTVRLSRLVQIFHMFQGNGPTNTYLDPEKRGGMPNWMGVGMPLSNPWTV